MDQNLKQQVEEVIFPILDKCHISHTWDNGNTVLCYTTVNATDSDASASFTESVHVTTLSSFANAFRVLLEDMNSFSKISKEDLILMSYLRASLKLLPAGPSEDTASE